jgi:hypothetical protein
MYRNSRVLLTQQSVALTSRAGSVTETEKSVFRKTEIETDVGIEKTEKTDNRQKITEITENSVFAIYRPVALLTVKMFYFSVA